MSSFSGLPRLNCHCAKGCAACTFNAPGKGDPAGTPAPEHCTACMPGFSATNDESGMTVCILDNNDDGGGGGENGDGEDEAANNGSEDEDGNDGADTTPRSDDATTTTAAAKKT